MFSNNKQRLQLSYFGNNKIPKETKFPQEVTLENKIEIKIGHGGHSGVCAPACISLAVPQASTHRQILTIQSAKCNAFLKSIYQQY